MPAILLLPAHSRGWAAAVETAAEREREQGDVGLLLTEAPIGEQESDERWVAVDEAELTAEVLAGFGRGSVPGTPLPPPVREGLV